MSFTLAAILAAIFTFAFGISDASAKTAILGYAGGSGSMIGDLKDVKSDGVNLGVGLWLNEGKRFSFRFSYMNQRGGADPFHWWVTNGEIILNGARFEGFEQEILALGIEPGKEYAGITSTQSISSGLTTFALGISIFPRKKINPVIWGIGGLDFRESEYKEVYNYDRLKLDAVTDFYRSKGFEGEYFRFDGDNGSGQRVSTVSEHKPVYGIGFSVAIRPGEHFVFMPEAGYLWPVHGFSAKVGCGPTF